MSNRENWRKLYPFAASQFAVGDVKMHYVDDGEGTPLLMVHGNPTWSFYWRRIIDAFRGDYRTIAVDHIGCGLSDKPQAYNYTLQQHVDNLSALVNELDLQQVTLIAHDWGGAIGLGTLLANQHRFRSIVLLNTGAFPPPFIPWRIRACRIPLLGTVGVRGLNLFARAALRMAMADPGKLTPDIRAGLLAPYNSWANRVAIDRFVKDIPATRRHPTWQTLDKMEQDLSELKDWPVQLIWGMKDWCFRPSCLKRFCEIFPDASVMELEKASHYVVEDDPLSVIKCMETFLHHVYGERDA